MRFGFPSGKLDKLKLFQAVDRNLAIAPKAVEVTALRYYEFDSILNDLNSLLIEGDTEVSFHAPANFSGWQEMYVAYRLRHKPYDRLPVVIHPDTIRDPCNWESFRSRLRIENMDLRKSTGITVEELRPFFELLPAAEWCFDVGHARQVDPTMDLAKHLLDAFGDRLAEIHMSVVLPCGKHSNLTEEAADDYRKLFKGMKVRVPVILETLLVDESMKRDVELASAIFE